MNAHPKPALSIIIPCYDEEENIPLLVKRFIEVRPADLSVELVLVDNGSTDNSAAVLAEQAKKHPFLKVVTVKPNIGYGNGVLQGLKHASGETLAWTHADLQTDLCDAIRAYALWSQQPDKERVFVKGYRVKRKLGEKLFSIAMQSVASLALGMPLSEINAQPKLFHRSFIQAFQDPPLDFSFDLYALALARKRGMRIVTIPVEFGKRQFGESDWSGTWRTRWKMIKRTYAFIFALRRRFNAQERMRNPPSTMR